jgi:hypothetical protein
MGFARSAFASRAAAYRSIAVSNSGERALDIPKLSRAAEWRQRGRNLNGGNFLEGWQSRNAAFGIADQLGLWSMMGGERKDGFRRSKGCYRTIRPHVRGLL